MEGRNCFRTKWVQSPFYSGGNVNIVRVVDAAGAHEDYLVTACENSVHVVNKETGEVLASYSSAASDDVVLHLDAVQCEGSDDSRKNTDTFVSRGSYVAFSTRSLQIYFLELKQTAGALQFALIKNWTASNQAVSMVKFSSNGLLLLTGCTDGSVKAWNVFHHHLTHNIKTQAGVITAMSLDESMKRLVVGNFEGYVTVVDFEKKVVIGVQRLHTSAVEAVRAHGGVLFTAGRDRRISRCNLADFSDALNIVVKEFVSCAVFDDDVLCVGATDGVAAVYRVGVPQGAKLVCRSSRPLGAKQDDDDEEYAVRSLIIRPAIAVDSGLALESHSTPGRSGVEFYCATAAFLVHKMSQESTTTAMRTDYTLVGFLDQVLDVRTIPGSSADRVVVTNSKEVRLFQGRGALSRLAFHGHSDIVMCCSISGGLLATGGKDKSVRIWRIATGELLFSGTDHEGDVTALSFNHKSTDTFHVVVSVGADSNLRLWDVDAAGKGNSPTMESKFAINAAHAGAVHCVAVAPNDQYVATGGKDKMIHVWTVQGKRLFKESVLRGHKRGVTSVAFSPTDRVLASCSNDASVRLWSLVSFACVKTMQSDKVGILQAAFFNKGTQLVTANAEGVLRFWALAASDAVATTEPHSDKVWGLVVCENSDGSGDLQIWSGGADGTIVLTEDYTAAEADRLEEERVSTIYNEQQLANAMRKGQYMEAFRLALELNHPRHLRQVLMKWVSLHEEECTHALQSDIMPSLKTPELQKLLTFTREWIANARHCVVASLVVQAFLGAFHFDAILNMGDVFRPLMEALLSYSARHSLRMRSSLQRTYYLDFLLKSLGGKETLQRDTGNLALQTSLKRTREE